MSLPPKCLSFGWPVSPACLSVSQTSMDDSRHKATLELKSSGCTVSNNFIYDPSLSLSVSVKVTVIVCTSPFLQGGVEPPTKF